MSAPTDLQWLFFDTFGTVVDWKSHISKTLLEISKRVDPEAAKAHTQASDAHWQDFAQEWRTGFMKGVKELMGKREDAGMDVRMHPLSWRDNVLSPWHGNKKAEPGADATCSAGTAPKAAG